MKIEQELKEFILSAASRQWAVRRTRKKEDYVSFLQNLYPSYDLAAQIRFFMDGLEKEPRCVICDGVLNLPHAKTCSRKCRDELKKQDGSFDRAQEKARKTSIERFGVPNPNQSKEVTQKRHATMMKKYNALVSPKARKATTERAPEMNKKARESLKRKHGVDNPGQLPGHRQKCIATLTKNFGTDHYTKSEEYKEKRVIRNEEKWKLFTPPGVEILDIADGPVEKKAKFENPNMVITFNCETCDSLQSLPTETYKWRINNTGTPCRKCSGINNGSIKENEIAAFIESLGIPVLRNDRQILYGKEIDILIRGKKIGIEFNGLFWHNELRVGREAHKQKHVSIKEKGYTPITIFEDEWDYRKEVVKSRLKNAVGLTDRSIHARKCIVKELSAAKAKEFVEKNHIQGYAPSSIKLGLYHNDELVSVMTFSSPSIAKGHKKEKGVWEISRSCSKLNTSVVGGAGKMFSHFVKNYNPIRVITFADLRWSNGNSYKNLGFTYQYETEPNYWYIDVDKRVNRFSLRKGVNEGDDPNLTEYENRLKQGYMRIWDCGSSKWVWEKE